MAAHADFVHAPRRSRAMGVECIHDIRELLSSRAVSEPQKLAYRFIERSGAVHELSRAALHHVSASLACRLQEFVPGGARVLLACASQRRFVIAFYACMQAGCVAVPAPPLVSKRLFGRLRLLASDAAAALVIVDSDVPASAGDEAALATLDMREFDTAPGTREVAPQGPMDVLAFLQYTSGSTSAPKGVMVTHRNVLANCATIAEGMRIDESSRILTALPLFHDMGLVGGVLVPLFCGAQATFLDPAAAVAQPALWLSAIYRHAISHSGGPNFLYDLAAEVSLSDLPGLDLSAWQVAYCGAEPIRPATIERFVQHFAPAGFNASSFYPCYGLAEATLFVSGAGTGTPVWQDPHMQGSASISCGRTWGDTEVAIVDPATCDKVPDGSQGEIWVRGASVAAGYWGQAESTAHAFGARIRASDDGPWLRTGDLGILKDAHLHVVGRIKDLIILRGRKFAPQDLELEADRSHRAVRASVAFACTDEEGERLVVVAETRRDWLRRIEDREAVRQSIRAALFASFQVQPHAIELVLPNALERTSSGKLRRGHTREQFLAGRFRAVVHGRT